MAGLLVEGWPALVNHRLTPATETSYRSPASWAEFPAAPPLTRYSSPPQDASQPVKQRRAMLASNPLRNSRSETITGATRGSSLLPLLTTNVFPMPGKTPSFRIFGNPPVSLTHQLQRERNRFPMPQKTQARTCANPPRELDYYPIEFQNSSRFLPPDSAIEPHLDSF